jgi:hypothetical protein
MPMKYGLGVGLDNGIGEGSRSKTTIGKILINFAIKSLHVLLC